MTRDELNKRARAIRSEIKTITKKRHNLQVFGGPNWVQNFDVCTWKLARLSTELDNIKLARKSL